MSGMPWTSIAVLLPLAGALILLCIPTTALPAPRFQALLFSGASFVLAVVQLFRIKRGVGTPQFVDHHRWISTVGLEWRVGVDGISIWLLLLTSGLFLVAIAAIAMRPPQRGHLFLGLLLLSEAGLMGLFASQNLLLFYLFWELMLIPFYFLIGIWGEGERVRNTTRFVIYTTAGSFLMLVGIAATGIIAAKVTGQFTLDMESLRGVRFSDTQSVWLFSAFAIAFAIKLPIWPLHGWMPGAYGSAPIVLTALLSAVMSKAGAYGLLRVGVPLYPHGASVLQTPIYLAAIIGIAYGSLVAWRQRSMRMLVAYSSLAHLGFIALGIMSFTNDGAQGAVLQMVNHGLVVAAAFLIVGILAERSGHEDVDDLGGLAQGAPWLGGVFLLVTMASLAVPGSNAFAGEFFILTGVFRHDWWAATLATIGIAYVPAIVFVGVVALVPSDELEANFLPSYGEYYGFIIAAIMIFVALVAPEVLCTDRRTGMLGVYLSSPLDRDSYLAAKAAAIVGVLSLVCLGPPLLMLIANVLQSTGPDGVGDIALTFARVLVAGSVGICSCCEGEQTATCKPVCEAAHGHPRPLLS